MNEGDFIDLLIPSEDQTRKVKRVRIVKIMPENKKDRQTVYLRVWRAGVAVV